jgi:malonyl CoA-acyl carrier protein transacylase
VPAFRETLAAIPMKDPKAPVMCGTTARPFDDIRARLADALTRPVRWTDTVIALDSLGVESFVESGPGKVLKNLVRRILPGVSAETLDRPSPSHA